MIDGCSWGCDVSRVKYISYTYISIYLPIKQVMYSLSLVRTSAPYVVTYNATALGMQQIVMRAWMCARETCGALCSVERMLQGAMTSYVCKMRAAIGFLYALPAHRDAYGPRWLCTFTSLPLYSTHGCRLVVLLGDRRSKLGSFTLE